MTPYRTGKLPAILSIALLLLGFLFILGALNLYQYYRVKNNLAAAGLTEISNIELVELQSFFTNIADSLTVVREWGENGLLRTRRTEDLNKKFFPLMNSSVQFTGLLLADSTGTEYYLYRSGTDLVTRSTVAGKNITRHAWQKWSKPDKAIEKWEEESDYDPRKRPWFIAPDAENRVSWTEKYTFFQSGKPGLTASVSWIDPDSSEKYMVFGIDLLVEDIEKLLSQQQERSGILFLVNSDTGDSIASSPAALAGSGNEPNQKKIISLAIGAWKKEGRPDGQSITFTLNRQKWLAQFHRLSRDNSSIWTGMAASEKDMAADLKKILFKMDLTDFTVAAAGGLLMLFLAWRFGWRRAEHGGTGKIDPAGLHEIINQGEGANLEFKASVRYNFKSGKTGKEIEFAWLKAVVAFLNSGGGILLLGVADDGTLTGIAHDHFDNDDRCLLHVKNLINQYIGAEFSRLINVRLLQHDTYRIVAVECESSPDPVFLRVGKNEEFYVRSGPSSTKLSPSQIIRYLHKNHS